MKQRIVLRASTILVFVLGLAACTNDSKRPPEVALPDVTLDIQRTEVSLKALYEAHRRDTPARPRAARVAQLAGYFELHAGQHYPFFSDLLSNTLDAPREQVGPFVAEFAMNPLWQGLIDSVLVQYPASEDLSLSLRKPLQRLIANFATVALRPIRTYTTGFEEPGLQTFDPGFLDAHFLGIGMHYHLGQSFSYPRDIPTYLRRRFTRAYLPVRVVDLYLEQLLPSPDAPGAQSQASPRLLDYVMAGGMRQLVLEALVPEAPDSVRWGYSAEQTVWAERNQALVYNQLVPLLFETDYLGFKQWVGEGPGTPQLSPDAPPRLGHWLGREVLRKYLREHPEVSLGQLALRTDYEALFKAAAYKPR